MKDVNQDKLKKLVGVVTSFRSQVYEIKKRLPIEIKEWIEVGTVHTFQGGERKLIIMSTVYGRDDGCFFIDANKSLLNVAVSRAKDSFLVFGDVHCLSEDRERPSGLLKQMILPNPLRLKKGRESEVALLD